MNPVISYSILGALIIIGFILFRYLRRNQRLEPSLLDTVFVEVKQEPKQEFLALEQEKKSFHEILSVHYSRTNSLQPLLDKFDAWLQFANDLWKKAPHGIRKKMCDSMTKTESLSDFYSPGQILYEDKDSIPAGYNPFVTNAFTNRFHSSREEFADWALFLGYSNILILKEISKEESEHYLLVVKRKFVNHSTMQGIIQFDVYKKAA